MTSMGYLPGVVLALFFAISSFSAEIIVNDAEGALGTTRAPMSTSVRLRSNEQRAVAKGQLHLREVTEGVSATQPTIPLQLLSAGSSSGLSQICWMMPAGPKGERTFKLELIRQGDDLEPEMNVKNTGGQFQIVDSGKAVLRYNYATIEPGDLTNVPQGARIYARARSDYIHPLFGLNGETLTQDWSKDHPHHRGIYWAWPEVDWEGNRGDLHALQHVFARPTGKCDISSGPVFAQIEAENVWKWGDTNGIVREVAILRAYKTTADSRIIDLEFQLTAMKEPVKLARRNTDKYGGLNIRCAAVTNQEIVTYSDTTNSQPRRAWAEISGRFNGAAKPSGMVILQHSSNPDYPGDWVQFPNLNWLQPTFPASGTRYELKPGKPLVLRFRLWLHQGGKTEADRCADQWTAFHAPSSPKYFPVYPGSERPKSQ